MKKRLIGITLGLSLSSMLIGSVAASASPATGIHVKAVVVNIAQVASGGALVTLSAITTNKENPSAISSPIRYAWDLTTDGIYETPLSVSPTIKQFYAHTASGLVTATVKAIGGTAVRGATDSVTFSTIALNGAKSGLHINAVVVRISQVASGGALVTLSVVATNKENGSAITMPIRYSWDLTTDGIFETPFSVSPTTTQFYVHTASGLVTATVKAIGGTTLRGAMDTVTFSTLP